MAALRNGGPTPAEGVGFLRGGFTHFYQQGGWGEENTVSYPSGVWGGATAEIKFVHSIALKSGIWRHHIY